MAKSFIQTHHNIGEFLHTGKTTYAIQYRPSKFCSDDFLERDVQSGPISICFIFLGDFIISYGSFYILFLIPFQLALRITHFLHTHFAQTFHYFQLFCIFFWFASFHSFLFQWTIAIVFTSINQNPFIYIYIYIHTNEFTPN